jgi:hypothetical protein
MKYLSVPPQPISDGPAGVTALSRRKGGRPRRFSYLSLLAQTSLGLLAVAALGGLSCLITTSPEFATPTRTPPFLTNLSPAPYQIQKVSSTGATAMYFGDHIRFQVVSEDLQGGALTALLLLDFEGFGVPFHPLLWGQPENIPPGHFNTPDAPPRDTFDFPVNFPAGITTGCHSVTLAVSHQFVQPPGTITFKPLDELDVATATWWYDLLDDSAPPHLLKDCISKSVTSSDAGADASDAGAP